MSQQSTILGLITGAQADVDARFAQLLKDAAAVPADSVTPPPVVVVPPVTGLLPQELKFDNAHIAALSIINTDGSVATIPDQIGGQDMQYVGLKPGTLNPTSPWLIDGQAIVFTNRPGTNFHSASFKAIPPPHEYWLVMRKMPGQTWEAMTEGSPISDMLSDNGGGLRVLFNNVSIANSKTPAPYAVHIIRLVVQPTSASLYIDGVFIGTNSDLTASGANTAKSITDNTTKSMHGIGTYTNNMDFDFFASYFKGGLFSDSDAADIYKALATKYNVGVQPNQILLSNIAWTNNKGVYTPSATVTNTPAGVKLLSQSQWKYRWFWKDDQTNYDTQTQFSTSYQVKTGSFPANDSTHSNVCMKFGVTPIDANGNSWREFSGTFGIYTQGSQM